MRATGPPVGRAGRAGGRTPAVLSLSPCVSANTAGPAGPGPLGQHSLRPESRISPAQRRRCGGRGRAMRATGPPADRAGPAGPSSRSAEPGRAAAVTVTDHAGLHRRDRERPPASQVHLAFPKNHAVVRGRPGPVRGRDVMTPRRGEAGTQEAERAGTGCGASTHPLGRPPTGAASAVAPHNLRRPRHAGPTRRLSQPRTQGRTQGARGDGWGVATCIRLCP
jgi:hypothetical protein